MAGRIRENLIYWRTSLADGALGEGKFTQADRKRFVDVPSEAVKSGALPLTVQANRQEPGHWTTPPVILPSPGPWQVRLVLLVTDFEQVTLSGDLVVKGPAE